MTQKAMPRSRGWNCPIHGRVFEASVDALRAMTTAGGLTATARCVICHRPLTLAEQAVEDLSPPPRGF